MGPSLLIYIKITERERDKQDTKEKKRMRATHGDVYGKLKKSPFHTKKRNIS